MKKGLILLLVRPGRILSLLPMESRKALQETTGLLLEWSNAGMGDSWRQFLNSNFPGGSGCPTPKLRNFM